MRVTRKMLAIYAVLRERGWTSASDIADAVGEPRQNLDHSIRRLMNGGVIERKTTLRPIHYRLSGDIPSGSLRALVDASEVYQEDNTK